MFHIAFGLTILVLVYSHPATAAVPPTENTAKVMFDGCLLAPGPTLTVVRVEDGETLLLNDGTQVRLIGTMTPRKPLIALTKSNFSRTRRATTRTHNGQSSDDASQAWRLPREVRRHLSALVLSRSVTLWGVASGARRTLSQFPRDRYGRVLAHVTVHLANPDGSQDSRWVQADLLRAGLARVYSATDARLCIKEMLHHERVARKKRLNLWRHSAYQVRPARAPEALLGRMHTFQIVEGRVRRVSRYRNVTYVNFGSRWKTDFTLVIERGAHRTLGKSRFVPADLEGQRIRVRGWIEARDGPMMRLTHPEQVERLEENARPPSLFQSGALAAFDTLRSHPAKRPIDRNGGASEPRGLPVTRTPEKVLTQPARRRKSSRATLLAPPREPANALRKTRQDDIEYLSM